jgi:hypothetical protein
VTIRLRCLYSYINTLTITHTLHSAHCTLHTAPRQRQDMDVDEEVEVCVYVCACVEQPCVFIAIHLLYACVCVLLPCASSSRCVCVYLGVCVCV